MPRACCLIRQDPGYRREAFIAGLQRAGYAVNMQSFQAAPGDVLMIWNRYGTFDSCALQFERARAQVLVAENGYLGRDWRGKNWYALSRNCHNGAGTWDVGAASRWDDWGYELAPWRAGGREVVILAARGIGPVGVAQPNTWPAEVQARLRRIGIQARIRRHPGEEKPAIALEDDLANAACVVTWGSGAALKALTLGIPVVSAMPGWIGAGAALPLEQFRSLADLRRDDAARLAMFRRLAWAMWSVEEIASGEPFRRLLPDHTRAAA